jgi:mono/diheme cytochrome c family protein
MKKLFKIVLVLVVLAVGAGALVWALNVRDEIDVKAPVANAAPSDNLIARGAYLARAGNCQACHTAPGGQA